MRSYVFLGSDGAMLGRRVASGDPGGDGTPDLLIGAVDPNYTGSSYLVDTAALEALDAAVGTLDGRIHLDAILEEDGVVRLDSTLFFGFQDGLHMTADALVLGAQSVDGQRGELRIVAAADLPALDPDADGQVALGTSHLAPASYRITGESLADRFGAGFADLGDIDGDGIADFAVSAHSASGEAGATYIVSGAQLADMDARDGSDGRISASNIRLEENSYRITGAAGDFSGTAIAAIGDIDGDLKADLVIGAFGGTGEVAGSGVIYVLSTAGLEGRDTADASNDNQIALANQAGTPGFYRITGETVLPSLGLGHSLDSVGDFDGDGLADFAAYPGYLVSTADLARAADPSGTVTTSDLLALGQNSYRFDAPTGQGITGFSGSGGLDGVTRADILLGLSQDGSGGSAWLIAAEDLAALDPDLDGTIALGDLAAHAPSSYRIEGLAGDAAAESVTVVADLDGDGRAELLIGSTGSDAGGPEAGAAFLVLSSQYEAWDLADGSDDNRITLDPGTMPVCFAAGMRIATVRGPVPAGEIRAGDRVLTRDHGYRPVRWVGHRHLPPAELAAWERFRPIRIGAGALGPGWPAQDLVVSPQHRVLVTGDEVRGLTGSAEALVPAKQLLTLPGVTLEGPEAGVTYVHLLLDRHEILLAEGAWVESLYTGPVGMAALPAAQRAEIFSLFPDLALPGAAPHAPPARPFLTGRAARHFVAHRRGLSVPAAASDAEEACDLALAQLAHRP